MIEYHLGAPRYPVLNAYFCSRAVHSYIIGPLGSGKTYGSVQRLLRQMCEQEPNAKGERPSRWIAIRNTYRDLVSTTIEDFGRVMGEIAKVTLGGQGPPIWRGKFRLRDGTVVDAEVLFVALDRDDDVKRLRGIQATGAWLNETSELERSAIDMAELRCGRFPSMAAGGVACTWYGVLGDTNAFDKEHWLYKSMEAKPKGWEFFIQPGGVMRDPEGQWVVNPGAENLRWLRKDYYEQGMVNKTEDWIRRFLANEFIFAVDGKPVHPHFNDLAHVSPRALVADPRYPLILGVDFGRTPAAAIMQLIPMYDRWNILDEMVTVDTSASLFGPALKRYLDRTYPRFQHQAWGDPAGDKSGQSVETTPIQILRAHGIQIRPAQSNVPALRRAALANPLARLCMDGKAAVQLDPNNCPTLRRALAGGFNFKRMRVPGTERFSEEPDKNEWSHIAEACEYGMLGGGEGKAAVMPDKHSWRPQQARQRRAL